MKWPALLAQDSERVVGTTRRWLTALVPLAGTAAFLVTTLPHTAWRINHLHHYGEKTAVEAFNPLVGIQNTCRSLVDNLLLGPFGITGLIGPVWIVPLGVALLIGLGVLWWRRAERRRLLLLGLAFILCSDLLVYSARAAWSYEGQVHAWTRYNLLPHLGLTLLLCGGLARTDVENCGRVTRPQYKFLAILMLMLLVINLPRGIAVAPTHRAEQMEVLREVEAMDARCRELHIDAEAARQVFGVLFVPYCGEDSNGWKFLRGSADPWPYSKEEVKALLVAEGR